MDDTYKTVDSPAEGLYKEKGSKFLAFLYPVRTEEEVKEKVGMLKEKYYDARHHCYAYRLGPDKLRFRFNDDGEPSSTAGKPIFGQIQSNDLTDVLIVVVRYFGGIKLGVSGLINAYRTAAADAVAHATVVEKTVEQLLKVRFGYEMMNEVMRIIKEEEVQVLGRKMEMECEMLLSVRDKKADHLRERLSRINFLTLEE